MAAPTTPAAPARAPHRPGAPPFARTLPRPAAHALSRPAAPPVARTLPRPAAHALSRPAAPPVARALPCRRARAPLALAALAVAGALGASAAETGVAQAQPAPEAATPAAPARVVYPVVVVGLGDRNVTPQFVAAARDAVVAGLRPHATGRPVVALPDQARIDALAACADAACLGARLAELQAVQGVLVRVGRSARNRPAEVRLEVLDPVSGAPRLPQPIVVSVPAAQEAAPAALLEAAIAQLVPLLPAPPPPPPSLMIVTNVDGARIELDGQAATAPVAPLEIAPGRHTLTVSAPGWVAQTRSIEVRESGTTRVDVDLVPTPETAARLAGGRPLVTAGPDGATSGDAAGGDDTPIYLRWYVLAGAAAVVVVATVVIIAVAASGDTVGPPNGVPVPPIQ
jgi:hypothetical protein